VLQQKLDPLVEAKKYNIRNTLQNNTALVQFANAFLLNKMDALEKDVDHCLISPYAPFPAIIFCLSTIDLLGALYAGEAAPKLVRRRKGAGRKLITVQPKTTRNSARYMKRFMGYSTESIRLLQSIFRHKLVHLAQPKPAIEDKTRVIAWRYYHKNRTKHLKLSKFRNPRRVKGLTPYSLHCNYGFKISISRLREDIRASVFATPTSYFNLLTHDKIRQRNFRRAINEIYNPITR
jgi:hypothetical protein